MWYLKMCFKKSIFYEKCVNTFWRHSESNFSQVDPIPGIEVDQSPNKKLRTKIDTSIEKGQVDPIPEIEMGQRSQNKIQLKELKVHVPPGKK